jgi:RNA polymerase sigma-70 factor (ECF subfamily)
VANEQCLEAELPAEDPYRDELTDEMQRAVDRLSPELKETLLLVVVAELTHQEASDMLGVPLGTVLSRVSRARSRLREYLTPNKSIDPEDRSRNNINTTK